MKNLNTFRDGVMVSNIREILTAPTKTYKWSQFPILLIVALSLFYSGCQESTVLSEDVIEPQSESEIMALPASQSYLDTLNFGNIGFDLYITDTSSIQDTFQFSGIDSSGNNFQINIIDVPNSDSLSYIVSGDGPLPGDTYVVKATVESNSMDNSTTIHSISISQNGGTFVNAASGYWDCVTETHELIMDWIDDRPYVAIPCRVGGFFSPVDCDDVAFGYALIHCLF